MISNSLTLAVKSSQHKKTNINNDLYKSIDLSSYYIKIFIHIAIAALNLIYKSLIPVLQSKIAFFNGASPGNDGTV